jgi:hypothetical protein
MEPVLGLTLVLIVVLVFGHLSVNMFREGATSSDVATTTARVNLAVGPQQGFMIRTFDGLKTRSNNIKQRIDTINQHIPRKIEDITISSITYVPWELKERSMIQITKEPYKTKQESDGCGCSYGCHWNIALTLPIGPTGNPGHPGPIGQPGKPSAPGVAGPPGPRGNWAA